jgi:hypothetical protein
MGRRHGRRDTNLIAYRVIHRTGDTPEDNKNDYDTVRADPRLARSRRAGVLDFVIYVIGEFRQVWWELKLKLEQCKEWFSMEREKNGCIRFKGTKKVLDYVEELGYRADLV